MEYQNPISSNEDVISSNEYERLLILAEKAEQFCNLGKDGKRAIKKAFDKYNEETERLFLLQGDNVLQAKVDCFNETGLARKIWKNSNFKSGEGVLLFVCNTII